MHVPINLYDGRILNNQHNLVKDGVRLKDISGGSNVTPLKSYLGPSNVSSSYEEITYQEVREEIIERKRSGLEPSGCGGSRKIQVPIRIVESERKNKTGSQLPTLSKDILCNPASNDKVGQERETFKPFSRKLTYTVPVVETKAKQTTSQQKVFPPKSPKKIQFRDDEKRSNYVFSTSNIIKDQSKPTPPDVDYGERSQYGVERSSPGPPESVRKTSWNAQDETERSIKKTGGLSKVLNQNSSIKKAESTGQSGEQEGSDKYQSFYENADTENIKLFSSQKDHQKFHQTTAGLAEMGGGRGSASGEERGERGEKEKKEGRETREEKEEKRKVVERKEREEREEKRKMGERKEREEREEKKKMEEIRKTEVRRKMEEWKEKEKLNELRSEALLLDSTDEKNLEVTMTEVRPERVRLTLTERSQPSYAKLVRQMKLDWLDGKHSEGNVEPGADIETLSAKKSEDLPTIVSESPVTTLDTTKPIPELSQSLDHLDGRLSLKTRKKNRNRKSRDKNPFLDFPAERERLGSLGLTEADCFACDAETQTKKKKKSSCWIC